MRRFILAVGVLAASPAAAARAETVRPPNDAFVQPESTRRMIARIREIYDHTDPLPNPFRSGDQIPLRRKLEREGVKTNRVALGARIKVVVTDETGAERAVHRTVGTGATFGSNPLRQEIGLGPAWSVVRVEVFWPVSGETQVFTGLEPNRLYRCANARRSLSRGH